MKKQKFQIIIFSLIILSFFSACKNSDTDKQTLDIFDKYNDVVYYNAFKETKTDPMLRQTYFFKKNGDFVSFNYEVGNKKGERFTSKESFNYPDSWKLDGDSLILDDHSLTHTPYKYKFNKIDNNQFELISRFDKIILKKVKDTFHIRFYHRNLKIYKLNKNKDTIGSFDILEL